MASQAQLATAATPAALTAQPQAALGGSAALAAETGQGMAENAGAKTPNGATPGAQAAAQAGAAALAAAQLLGRSSAGTARNGAPAIGPSQSGTGDDASPSRQNAQTPLAESRNAQAANTVAQNAHTGGARRQTAQSLGAPVPVGETPAEATGKPAAAPIEPARAAQAQGSEQAIPKAAHATANQGSHADATAQGGQASQGLTANGAISAGNIMDRAATPTPSQRAEGAGPSSAGPWGAGAFGLAQAAAHMPQSLPAQARPAALPTVPADQVAVHIQRAAAAGQDRIRIRLHPAELGQIEVKLRLTSDGTVKAIVTVDRPETFELLQRDTRGLERALQDAGLKTDSGSLNFNLKGESELGSNGEHEGLELDAAEPETAPDAEPQVAPDALADAPLASPHRALDMRV